jgi:hypothetical protein
MTTAYAKVPVRPEDLIPIYEALLEAFPQRARIVELLLRCNRMFDHYEITGTDFSGNVLAVTMTAEREGWLVGLLEQAVAKVPDAKLQRLLDGLRHTPVRADADPFTACRLSGGYVMIDRSPVRDGLRQLREPNGRRILVVNGPRYSGRSHTLQLISYHHLVRQSPRVVPVDLAVFARMRGPQVVVTPHDLAVSITSKLGYQCQVADPPHDGQWSTWVIKFCDDFEPFAADDARNPWLLIDALDSVVTLQSTLDLIGELARRIAQHLTGLRLVLLGYGGSLAAISRQVRTHDLDQIGVAEVLEFFRDALDELGVAWTDAQLVELATRVLSGLDPAGEDYLRTVGERAGDELDLLYASRGGA